MAQWLPIWLNARLPCRVQNARRPAACGWDRDDRRRVCAGGSILATAKPVRVSVDGMAETIDTHRASVGTLLFGLGLTPTPQDRVSQPLDGAVERDMTIVVEQARPRACGPTVVTLWAELGATPCASRGPRWHPPRHAR